MDACGHRQRRLQRTGDTGYGPDASVGPNNVTGGVQYTLSESGGPSGYSSTGVWSCTGTGTFVSPNKITLAVGQTASCSITNDDIAPTLTLNKHVINDNGGTANASAWTLAATGSGGFSGTGTPATGTDASVGPNNVTGGVQYTLSESGGPSGYSTTGVWSCTGTGTFVSPNKITLGVGQTASCSITNDDIAPTLTLNKHVINDNGGTANASAWTLTAAGSSGGFSGTGTPATGTDASVGPNNVTGGVQYTLSESGGPSGYSTTGVWSCTGTGTFVSPNKITLAFGQTASCTITNDDIAPSVQFTSATYIEDESQTATIGVTRTGNTAGTTTVVFNTIDTSGTGGPNPGTCGVGNADYVAVTNLTVTFNPGSTVPSTPVQVVLCGDSLTELPENISMALSAPTNGTLGSPNTATLTINDTANQYRSTVPIAFTLGNDASPYPSTIVVSGATPVIGSMRVTLYDVSHGLPANMEFLLVSPTGHAFVFMEGGGGPFAIDPNNPVTLTFSDAAGAILPQTQLATGKYEPTTWDTPISTFTGGTPPAPAGPYNEAGHTLGGTPTQTFDGNYGGSNPNGTWLLYARDDNGTPFTQTLVGQVAGGWGLEFLQSTAAGVSVSGRVTTSDGRALRNATVSLVDSQGVARTALTDALGNYTFDNVGTGETYIIGVASKRYRFASRVLQVFDTVAGEDFVGEE